MNLKRLNILYAIFLCSLTSQAADSINYSRLTLKQAIEIGMLNNKEVQSGKIETEISKEKEKEVFNHKLPEIGFNSSYKRLTNLYQYENGLGAEPTRYEPAKDVYEFSLDASVPLYTGGKLSAELQKSKVEMHLAELKSQHSQRIVKLDIATQFLHIYRLQEQQKLILEKIKEDSLNIKQVDAMRRNGASTKNEVLRTKLQLSNHKMLLSTINNDIIIGEHQLQTLLDLTDLPALHIDTVSLNNFYNDSQPDMQTTAAQNDELLMSRDAFEMQKIDRKVVRSSALPQLSLFGSYSLMNPNYKFYPPQPYFYRMGLIGLNLRFSISELYKNTTKTNMANLAITRKQVEMEQTNEKVNHATFAARQKLVEADERIQIAMEAIEQAKENYRTVKQKYVENLSLITELIDADNAYLEAQSALITTKIDKQLKYFQLQYILGNL